MIQIRNHKVNTSVPKIPWTERNTNPNCEMFQSFSFFFSFYTWNGLRLDFYNRTITITIPNTILFFLLLFIILQYYVHFWTNIVFSFPYGLMGKELEEQIYIGSSSIDVITILWWLFRLNLLLIIGLRLNVFGLQFEVYDYPLEFFEFQNCQPHWDACTLEYQTTPFA